MKRDTRYFVLLVVCVLGLAFSAAGQTAKIKTYDVKSAVQSGYGCWYWAYSGTITETGRTSSTWGTCTVEGPFIADYSGGSGTLNDNIFSSTISDNQLFSLEPDDYGQPILPEIILHLDGSIRLAGSGFSEDMSNTMLLLARCPVLPLRLTEPASICPYSPLVLRILSAYIPTASSYLPARLWRGSPPARSC